MPWPDLMNPASQNESSNESPNAESNAQLWTAQSIASEETPRRSVLSRMTSIVMGVGIGLGYGMFAWVIGRFLYPHRGQGSQWQFLARLKSFEVGQTMTYRSPAGQDIVVTRLKQDEASESFIALSNVCPHLGCQVHWQQARERFFCPCHNGAFDANGQPTEGPPKTASQSLPRYPLKVERGLLFIEVSTERLV